MTKKTRKGPLSINGILRRFMYEKTEKIKKKYPKTLNSLTEHLINTLFYFCDLGLTKFLFNRMRKKELEDRIKALERELSNKNALILDAQKPHQSEARFHNLIEQSIYPILILKGEDMIMEIANDPILKIFNVGKEALGKPFLDILPEMKDQPFIGLLLDVLHNHITHYGTEQPAYFMRENGEKEIVYFNFVYHPYKENDGTVSGVIVNATDVTEQVLARQKVEESEAQLRSFVMQAPFAIGIYKGKEYMAEVVNERALQMLSKGIDFVGKPLFDALPELETQGLKGLMDTVMQSGNTYYGNELEFNIHKNNISTQGFYNFIIQPLKIDNQSVAGTIVVANEVTEQVLARKKVEETEHRYHNMIYSSPYMIGIFKGKDTIIEIANDAILETWGKGKDIIGKPLFEVIPEAAEQGFDKLIQNVYETGEPYHAYETPVTLLRNGKQQLMHYNFIYQAQRNVDGEIVGVAILANEVTKQVEAKKIIEDSQNQLQNIFMQAPFALNIYEGKELVISLANKLFCEIIGKTESEILGKKLFDAFPETATQGLDKILSDIFSTGIPFKGNEFPVNFLKHGNEFKGFFDFIYQPIFDYNKNVSGVINVAIDVTDKVLARKKIEESEQKFEAAILAVEGVIWTNNANGEMNGEQLGWANLTGQGFEEYQGFGWTNAVHPDDVASTVAAWNKAVANNSTFEFEHRVMTKLDGWKLFSIKAVPVFDENKTIQQWVGVHTDVSKQKEAEQKLIEAKESAENAAKSKQQFLSNMSHEIRTPLNSILGFTNVLLKTELDEKQTDFVQAIKTSSTSLNVLINDILDLAKVDAGKMTFVKQPFDMHKSIRSILHSFDLKIKEKNLELVKEYDSDIPVLLLGDSVRLNQIILNLMSNAIKFTHKGKITLSVKIQSETEENVSIEFVLTDTGIGIADNKMDSIFHLFEQADINTSTAYGGTGLGLAIVKQLVEFQGGSISASSKIGEGSTFSFILPFGKTTVQIVEEVEILKLDATIKNLRVLVAEDVVLNQLLIKMILSDFGFEHDVVDNGKIAIEKLQTSTYDIVLMDLQMPEMNGFEATEYIRNSMKSNIPIIALTADVTTVDTDKCKAFGMDDYVSKPIEENELYSKIMGLVNRQ
jgi:PAS domain S-box-containing protein